MAQNQRNQPGDNQGSPGRGLNENRESSYYEGFEGMNFEQIRQPYNPQRAGNHSKEDEDKQQKGEEKG